MTTGSLYLCVCVLGGRGGDRRVDLVKREEKSHLLAIFSPSEGRFSEKWWATPYTFIEIKKIMILLLLGSKYMI